MNEIFRVLENCNSDYIISGPLMFKTGKQPAYKMSEEEITVGPLEGSGLRLSSNGVDFNHVIFPYKAICGFPLMGYWCLSVVDL